VKLGLLKSFRKEKKVFLSGEEHNLRFMYLAYCDKNHQILINAFLAARRLLQFQGVDLAVLIKEFGYVLLRATNFPLLCISYLYYCLYIYIIISLLC